MTLKRWLALCGVAATVLVALAFTVVGGSTPDDKAGSAEVLTFYRDHKTAQLVAALMVVIAAVLFVMFGARLRDALRGTGAGDGLLPAVAFGGTIVLASGLLFMAMVHFALVQAADHKFAVAAQTLNVLDNNDFFGLVGGIAIVMLSGGLATVRAPVLPRWLGWAAIVFGILCLAGPLGFFGFLLGALWLLVVSIMLTVRKDEAAVAA